MAFPWEFHPDLSRERLIAIANLIASGRDTAVRRHDPAIGDDDWVLGCRAFQCSRYNIFSAAGSGAVPWLSVMDASRHFMFRLGSIPLRFYRGDPEDPYHRVKYQSFPELDQLSLIFPERDMRELVCRIAVETDFDGRALAIYCVGTRGEDVVFNWSIPFAAIAPTLTILGPPAAGVDLAPPVVGELEEEFSDAEEANGGKTDAEA